MTDEVTEATEDSGSLDAAALAFKTAREAVPIEKKQPEAVEPAATVATAATEETPADDNSAGDDIDPAESDADDTSPIAAPARWTAEDKEWFATLPPERQERILRGEQGQRAAEVKRQQEVTAERQRYEQEARAAAQERQYFQSVLQQFKNPLVSAFNQEFADVVKGEMDILRLASDPQRWNRYQAFQSKFAQIAGHENQLAQKAEAEESARMEKHAEERNAQLMEEYPELKKPENFEKFDKEMSEYLVGAGIPPEMVARASFIELKLARKAMNWDRAQKAKAAAPKPAPLQPGQVAVQSHLRTVPKVMKPGASRDAGSADDKIAAIDQRARSTGSLDDAAARISARLRRA